MSGGPWYGADREAASLLAVVEYDQADGNDMELEDIEHALRRAAHVGAGATRAAVIALLASRRNPHNDLLIDALIAEIGEAPFPAMIEAGEVTR